MQTVTMMNEEAVALAVLRAMGAPEPSEQLQDLRDKESTRAVKQKALRSSDESRKGEVEFQKTCETLFIEQASGRQVTEGNIFFLGILAHGRPGDREYLISRIRRTIRKQIGRTLAGARSQSSAKSQAGKAIAQAEEELLSSEQYSLAVTSRAMLRSDAKTLANDTLARKDREEYTRLGRPLSDQSAVMQEDLLDEAEGFILAWLWKSREHLREEHTENCKKCHQGLPCKTVETLRSFSMDVPFLSQVKARAHQGLRVYLRRSQWDLVGLYDDLDFGEVTTDVEGNTYKAHVPFHRSEQSRLADILQVTSDLCEKAHLSESRKSRILSLVECAFYGRDDSLLYPQTSSRRELKSRDIHLLRSFAEVNEDLRTVLRAS